MNCIQIFTIQSKHIQAKVNYFLIFFLFIIPFIKYLQVVLAILPTSIYVSWSLCLRLFAVNLLQSWFSNGDQSGGIPETRKPHPQTLSIAIRFSVPQPSSIQYPLTIIHSPLTIWGIRRSRGREIN